MNTLTDYMFYKAGLAKIPFSGTFELSPVCNFSCRMCYVRRTAEEVRQSPRRIMVLSDWLRLAEEARSMGTLYILLTGGEPLLWSDFWPLYETLIDRGFLVSVNTNGSLIDEDAAARFRRRPPRRINITLYGACNETYETLCRTKNGFSRVDAAVCRLKAAGLPLKLNCSMTPYNAKDLEEIVRYSEEKQCLLQIADYMFPPIRRDDTMTGQNDRFTPEEAAELRLKAYRLQNGEERYQAYLQNILKGDVPPPVPDEDCIDGTAGKIRCRAGKSAFWVTWDGQLSPCGMMNQPLADVKKRPFPEAWQELTERTAAIQTAGTCSDCKSAQICHACAAMSLAETGSFRKVPSYLCEISKALRTRAEKDCINPPVV
ncbi:MAG: radical SAM protein [Clostridia bacterium]|nr:radical SAM protein [Clostridia bacterium]